MGPPSLRLHWPGQVVIGIITASAPATTATTVVITITENYRHFGKDVSH